MVKLIVRFTQSVFRAGVCTRRRVFGEHVPYFLVLANNKQSA